MDKKISIILCTYNEVNHIEECISLISKTLKNVEIIIVDDDSNDGTLEKLDKLKHTFDFKLFVRKNDRGLASAQKKAFGESTGDFVGTIDVNSYDVYKDTIIFSITENQRKKFAKYALKKDNPKIPKKLRATYWITQIFLPRNIKKYLVKWKLNITLLLIGWKMIGKTIVFDCSVNPLEVYVL